MRRFALAMALAFSSAMAVHAQSPVPDPGREMSDMPGMSMQTEGSAQDFLMSQASGTSRNPSAIPMSMTMEQKGKWTLMLHGSAFLSHVDEDGPRGDDKTFSTNWLMGIADRPLAGGQLMIRSMLSLEPATVTHRSYPELFQTGETAYGKPLSDGQHPHDFFMELAVEYAHPIGSAIAYLYAAPVGDPALGPVAFSHRLSAAELPQATLAHHLEDSTHIADDVVTAGLNVGMFAVEGSGFHGAEPGEDRWNIDSGPIDSWSARFVLTPSSNWAAQLSTGHLHHPEQLETGDVQRTTASVAYDRPISEGAWATTLIWGHNEKETQHRSLNGYTIESSLQFRRLNYAVARLEIVDKDELFAADSVPAPIADSIFKVKALTVGYTRDLVAGKGWVGGAGGNLTTYEIPSAIEPFYGRHPRSIYLFLRVKSASGKSMNGM